ncbi:hypothetical protein RRG08_059790 [Elysia crispata]|uniref:Uncharacterized protein n=1 Tax=Elysia crispata TaxID=231223 RepID=A0AAE1EDV7_9GAST|nr:hypothetical protein RRG08_059790 [Elysia crispata]
MHNFGKDPGKATPRPSRPPPPPLASLTPTPISTRGSTFHYFLTVTPALPVSTGSLEYRSALLILGKAPEQKPPWIELDRPRP